MNPRNREKIRHGDTENLGEHCSQSVTTPIAGNSIKGIFSWLILNITMEFSPGGSPKSEADLSAVAARCTDLVLLAANELSAQLSAEQGKELRILALGRQHQRVEQAGAAAAVPASPCQSAHRQTNLQKVHTFKALERQFITSALSSV